MLDVANDAGHPIVGFVMVLVVSNPIQHAVDVWYDPNDSARL